MSEDLKNKEVKKRKFLLVIVGLIVHVMKKS